jgi:ATP adenylyltransferase
VRIPWVAGSLWQKLKTQTQYGLSTGALQPIETATEYVEAAGIRFLVRVLANLSRKEKARKQQGKSAPSNPFLPYEQDLYVTDISSTHLCLLNKFNVVDHHFLIVTREFEPQENWLTLADFDALTRCLDEVDGLGFFNGGKTAGASQPHKHLQVVPLVDMELPIEVAIAQTKPQSGKLQSPLLPFDHAIAHLDPIDATANYNKTAQSYLDSYQKLLSAVGIDSSNDWKGEQTAAYNLLCTQRWMMIVPRSQEKYAGISVNSLGFAGSLLVKNKEKLEQLKQLGPIELLQQVGK